MCKILAWYGDEKEGALCGVRSLFIRGNEEDSTNLAIWKANRMRLDWIQIYFGAGSSVPNIAKINSFLDHNVSELSGKIVTIETPVSNIVDLTQLSYAGSLDVRIVVTCAVTYIPNKCSVKLRTDKDLIISTMSAAVKFDDANGMYKTDVALITANDEQDSSSSS